MIDFDRPNPFWVLRLPTSATAADVVASADELAELAGTEEERVLIRWAVEALITLPETRALYEILEAPGAQYDEDREWERFARRYKRNPITAGSAAETSPATLAGAFDLVAIIDLIVEDLLRVPTANIADALAVPPVTPTVGPPPVEVWDVLFG